MPDKRNKLRAKRNRGVIQPRNIKLYVDEDVEDWAVEEIRTIKLNVKTVREAGNAGRDDLFQATFAAKQKRVLLTRNGKHYLDDAALPMQRTYGVIVLDVNLRSRMSYITGLHLLMYVIAPWADIYERKKITVSQGGMRCRYIDEAGQLKDERFTIDELISDRYPGDDHDV